MIHTKYLIIGASAAGISAANNLAKLDPGSDILVVGSEKVPPYNKCFLVDWLVGEKGYEQLALKVDPRIKLIRDTKILKLDIANKVATLSDKQQVCYEKALLAIGVRPFVPPIAGLKHAEHVFTFHDLLDTEKIQNFIKFFRPKNVVVIGAGLTGLECADALWRLGLQVSIVECGPQLLGKLVDSAGAAFLKNHIEQLGVKIELNACVSEIDTQNIICDSGKILPADLIIIATGVRPNHLEIQGGELKYLDHYVSVDCHLQTNLPDIWAAGDLIVVPDLLTGRPTPTCSWPDAMFQGNLAAANMAGFAKAFPGLLSVAKSHFFSKEFVSFGQVVDNISLNQINQTVDSYQKIVLNEEKIVQAALLIGDISAFSDLKRAALFKLALKS